MIIDATDLIIGRIATVAAKKALLGEEVKVVNCEKAIITGNKKRIIDDFKQKRERGIPLKGPYYPRQSHMILKRTIRGMLPYKRERGREALKKIKCFNGVPETLKNEKLETIQGASITKLPNTKYIALSAVSMRLGAK